MKAPLSLVLLIVFLFGFSVHATAAQQGPKNDANISLLHQLLGKIKSQKKVTGGVVMRAPGYAVRLDEVNDFVFLNGTRSARLQWRTYPSIEFWQLDIAGKSISTQSNFVDVDLPQVTDDKFIIWSLTSGRDSTGSDVKRFQGVASVSEFLDSDDSAELVRFINSAMFHSRKFSTEKTVICEWFRMENHIEWNQHCAPSL